MKDRGKWQGMLTIVRFNWPFYLAISLILAAALSGWPFLQGWPWELGCGAIAAGSLYFALISLTVSHLIYDRSDLYRWGWLDRALGGARPRNILFCHCGFDETSASLREKLQPDAWLTLDHFDSRRMTEASIQRARALFPPSPGTLPAPFDCWPAKPASADLIVGLLAIHELRSKEERYAWFGEARRCLQANGRIVLVEHTRNFANLLAFGPGFLHFHTTGSWRLCWETANLRAKDEFRITPWVKVFVLLAQ